MDEVRLSETQMQLQEVINELEWRNRRLNLEFHGILVTPGEYLPSKVNEFAPVLEVPCLKDNDITAIHRLPARPDKTPGIIVRLSRQRQRERDVVR